MRLGVTQPHEVHRLKRLWLLAALCVVPSPIGLTPAPLSYPIRKVTNAEKRKVGT